MNSHSVHGHLFLFSFFSVFCFALLSRSSTYLWHSFRLKCNLVTFAQLPQMFPQKNSDHVCVCRFARTITNIGMGRSKFLPKPLPQEINMLLTECDMNCCPDSSGKAITTMASSMAPIAHPTDTKASITQSDTSSQPITANNSADSYNGNCMDTLDDDDDDDNRIG